MFRWFGYKLHILCDSRHEVALGYEVTPASRADNEVGIRPVIEFRRMWKEEQEWALEGSGTGNVVYDEAGTVYCYDMVSDPPVRHQMAYIGYEPGHGTLKYRCPAEHESWRWGGVSHAGGSGDAGAYWLAELLAKAPWRDSAQRLEQTRLSPIARALMNQSIDIVK